jgi:DNA-binding transcriptional ArsR family regulator
MGLEQQEGQPSEDLSKEDLESGPDPAILQAAEGQDFNKLEPAMQDALTVLSAKGDLSPENAERLRAIMPNISQMDKSSRERHLRKLQELRLLTKEERGGQRAT